MRRIILLAALAAFPCIALAQGPTFPRPLTVSWTNASQYTDGTAIEAGDLTGMRLECTRQGEAAPVVSATFPANGQGSTQQETLAGAIPRPGTYTCRGYSVVIGGIESDPSSSSTVKHVGQPGPPTTFRVQ
jgi:hypothetical protein